MNRFISILLFLCVLYGCEKNTGFYYPSEKERLSDEISKQVAIQLGKERDLYLCGTGGQTADGVKMLALSFDYYHNIDVEKGRELLMTSVDTFISAINANEQIRPYLVNYPFESKNVEIRIFLRKPNGSRVAPGMWCVMSVTQGMLSYDINDPETTHLKTIYEETYEEALLKIRSNPNL